MKPKYFVGLSPEQRVQLQVLVNTGTSSAYRIKHAHILLAVDRDGPAWSDERAAQAYHGHPDTVYHARRHLVEQGLEEALGRRKQAWPSRRPKLDGRAKPNSPAWPAAKPRTGAAAGPWNCWEHNGWNCAWWSPLLRRR